MEVVVAVAVVVTAESYPAAYQRASHDTVANAQGIAMQHPSPRSRGVEKEVSWQERWK